MFSQYATAQTPSISITNQRCVNGAAVSTVTFTGFPEGNTVFTRSDLSIGTHLTTFSMPSSGTFTLVHWPLISGTFTYTAFSDPNHNSILDHGEVSASVTATTINCSTPTK
jgi:hypothetical protein